MKTLKIAIILTTVIALATVTIGLTLAHNFGSEGFFGGMMGYTTHTGDEDWWTEMREHMEGRWTGIEDEEWFDDMTAYMEEHWTCLLYTSPSPRDRQRSRMPSSA